MNASVDMRGYSRFYNGLISALVGTGQDGDLAAVCKSEVRTLSMELAHKVGYKSKESGRKAIEKDVRKVIAPGPEVVFEASKRKSAIYETGITWLYAGPAYLVGVRDEDIQLEMSLDAMKTALNTARAASFPRGKGWSLLSKRGKQHVMMRNRILTTRARFDALVNSVAGRAGILKSKFAFAAHKLGQLRIPSWIATHFGNVEQNGSAIFRFVGSGDTFAIEFGARAPGVLSNEHIQSGIQSALHTRRHKLHEKTAKVLQGHIYDWNTGRVFKRNKGEEMMKQLEANEQAFAAA